MERGRTTASVLAAGIAVAGIAMVAAANTTDEARWRGKSKLRDAP